MRLLLLAEALGLLDGKHQLLLHLLVTLVGWQVQSIKAGAWKGETKGGITSRIRRDLLTSISVKWCTVVIVKRHAI